ncbi:MAG: hypothetical protein OH319_02655 [Candidatus Parvarchaeota archaeon]|nr:hypothetical protein [Candidatus Jingweiarchaeum tengchongense]MCW1298269.1 hypothetical protein [Candidatus Jingweiarchaeum tengchongense]MCW1304795.1 hypothetical protein [Candidatus Jingweiarchaeum tengchongense]MCW1305385.1 hypothetical protein [Candidatus Jingweiarchaeum tengchongense]MCW1310507.1 hypothetical protein [Candidatus Jingweiarchaeum tengchongense]
MPDLYDKLKEDPNYFLKIENETRAKIARGGKVNQSPLRLILIPDREILRKRIYEKYGIKNIDKYFIPIIVDRATYREIKGEKETSILTKDWFEDLLRVEAHVKRVDDFFVSYIDVNFGSQIDQAIEHEAIHAHILGKNPNFYDITPNFGFGVITPTLNFEKLNWLEIISYVATMSEKDIKEIKKKSNPLFISNSKLIKKNPNKLKGGIIAGIVLSPILTMNESLEKIIDRRASDLPYLFGKKFIQVILSPAYLRTDFKKLLKDSDESFRFAHNLKKKLGLKRFIKEVSEKSKEELMREYARSL